jgi:toxin secretion/phage lysis holin
MKHIFQSFFAVVGTVLTYLFGGWSAVIGILIAFVVLDYITGVLAAGSKGKLSSAVGMRGIAKKIGIFVLVAIAHLVDRALGDGTLIRDAAIFFYLANELLSIIENAGALGVPIPDILLRAVEILKGKADPQN